MFPLSCITAESLYYALKQVKSNAYEKHYEMYWKESCRGEDMCIFMTQTAIGSTNESSVYNPNNISNSTFRQGEHDLNSAQKLQIFRLIQNVDYPNEIG